MSGNSRSSVGEELGGEVTIAGIWQQYYDVLSFVFRALGQLYGCCQGSTGGYANQDALSMRELTAIGEGVFVLDGQYLVIDLCIQGLWYEAGADSLDFMRSGSSLGKHGGGSWLDGNDFDGWIL